MARINPLFMALAVALHALPAAAQTPATPERSIRIAAYLQPQYERLDGADDGGAQDRVFFRRALLILDGQPARDWFGAFFVDFGPAASGGRVIVKDAYLQYRGWRDKGVTVSVGNQKTPFSRSVMASSARRGLVERPVTGDKAFGAPGRTISVRADGWSPGPRTRWFAALGSALHAPSADEIRLDGIPEASSTWNEGVLVTGRFEWHPLGEMALDHSDFSRGPMRVAIGAAAYSWTNDGDRNLHTVDGTSVAPALADADHARGLEVGGGLRGRGLSVEAALSRISSHALDRAFSGGLYRAGEAHVQSASLEAGYMLVPKRLEPLVGIEMLDCDTFDARWHRASAGLNWYFGSHDVKFQMMYRLSRNNRGVAGARVHATHLQAQFGF